MKAATKNEFTFYPGHFKKKLTVADIQHFFKEMDKDKIKKPMINIEETEDHLNVEIVIPGVNKEEIYTEIVGDSLFVYVLHDAINQADNLMKHQENHKKCFQCKIDLPNESDTSFIHSHYKDGILIIRIPKSKNGIKIKNGGIVIY